MDTITLDKLKVSALIGTYPHERKLKQPLIITCKFTTNAKVIAEQDDLAKAIDYATMTQSIIEFAENTEFHLIETFAEKLSQQLLNEFKLSKLKLTVTKPLAIKEAEGVSITIERAKNAT